ncbi:ATP-binding protein [Candidatus Hakubella thermalkaliphila]|nr:ATP-binding protein [Candidatus Hakubella thermalkaliphila]
MNDSHSELESKYKPRWVAPLIRGAIEDHPVVVLSGARQVGKSTLLQNESPFPAWRYITFDDIDVLGQAEADPASLWAGVNEIILDEVQKTPFILPAVKRAVDRDRRNKRFILSGSANILLLQKVSETLAGRSVLFNLYPMTLGETLEKPIEGGLDLLFKGDVPCDGVFSQEMLDPIPLILRGFMPPLLSYQRAEDFILWWEGYVATYLERDLRQLSQIESLPAFRRLMGALALRNGQLVNQTEIARDTGISQPTVYRYINLLEATCLLERLPAFAINRTKRLIKSPKIYWIDPGLCSFLAGYYDEESLLHAREVGSFFETLVFLHLKALSQLLIPRANIYYWRTASGEEVDFVIEQGRKLIAMEVKLTNALRYEDTHGLRVFLREYPETVLGILVYAGNEVRHLHEKIIAIPWTIFGRGEL